MSIQDQVLISAVIALAVILALFLARNRLGRLNTASWLVILGALVMVSEHGQFALSFRPIFRDAKAQDAFSKP